MWFSASEVVPVSRPQHSDLQEEDNRGNSSDEIEDCLNELEIHDEDMYYEPEVHLPCIQLPQ